MHVSYISLALFAIGAIGAPAAPKPGTDFGDITSGFPFNPTGSSSVQDSEESFGDSFASALEAMKQAEAAKQSAKHATPAPTSAAQPIVEKPEPTFAHEVVNFPAPVVSQAPTLSHAASSTAISTPVQSSSAATPISSHAVIPSPSKSASASDVSNAIPSATPSATPSAVGALGSIVEELPLLGGLVKGPMRTLGLRR
ncbi:hypothetical protein N7491_009489 [Penicillium cf. griseofulvum]|uniref:Uncharacterized protein n=1 Tax=Penicillium cf. griseofulvum TaxID=2972120 RepID=A0A9W9JMJ5_9EURO|nr:hypothetical protein N7472_004917 [Penicillium cf. griseofulvum]KAJ5424273.1 hypothetical protein N7491_009489 [Penicillium cf. griseofulvum]KAJ5442486.1 hypothetical protein N7445_005493 [Penicillium cf. griseofulvum]